MVSSLGYSLDVISICEVKVVLDARGWKEWRLDLRSGMLVDQQSANHSVLLNIICSALNRHQVRAA